MEFKTSVTTHDVPAYSAKATNKLIYPNWLYGLVAESERKILARFLTYNEGVDCFSGLGGLRSTHGFTAAT